MNKLARKLTELFLGHDPVLEPHELKILGFICEHLPDQDQEIMRQQLLSFRGIQRWAGGRISHISLKSGASIFKNSDSRYIVELKLWTGGKLRKMQLYARNGHMAILECCFPLSKLAQAPFDMLEVILEPKTPLKVAQAINRIEHGKEFADEDA